MKSKSVSNILSRLEMSGYSNTLPYYLIEKHGVCVASGLGLNVILEQGNIVGTIVIIESVKGNPVVLDLVEFLVVGVDEMREYLIHIETDKKFRRRDIPDNLIEILLIEAPERFVKDWGIINNVEFVKGEIKKFSKLKGITPEDEEILKKIKGKLALYNI
jgi:hypothetical protein